MATGRQVAAFLGMQAVFLVALLLLSAKVIAVFLAPLVSETTIDVVIAIFCVSTVFWQSTYVYRTLAMKRAVLVDGRAPQGLRIAMATTIVPSREFGLLREKLEGMLQVDPCGNALDLWVLDEEDDPRVRELIEACNRRWRQRGARIRHFTRKGIERYNEPPSGRQFKRFQARQKGGNINAWLDATRDERYDLITFLDLDHIPVPGFYRKVLPYFRDQDVAFVQGPESFRNRDENFVTRAASLERDTFFGLIHRGYYGLGMPVIVGSHTTFRAATFDALDGFYPVHLTEDYLIMLRLRAARKRAVFVDDILAVGELPSTWAAYLGQQQRWASGGLDLVLRYFPRLWRSYSGKERLFGFVLLNYYAWGTFFVLSKAVLCALLLGGLTIRLEGGLIAAVGVFTVVVMVANHLWERQFFIERRRRHFVLENAVMNNFLGGLYFVSLLKAIAAPNTPFHVTAKSGASGRPATRLVSYPVLAAVTVGLEVTALAVAWGWVIRAGGSAGQYDIVAIPLVISAVANFAILIAYRQLERAAKPVHLRRMRSTRGDSAMADEPIVDLDLRRRVS